MGIDLSKDSQKIVNSTGAVPDELRLNVTYRVAQGKGLAAKMAAKLGAKLDLDALLIAFNSRNEIVSCAGPEDLDPFGGSVVHTGDAKAGGGGEATETVVVKPGQVPGSINAFVLALVAYGNTEAFGKLSQLSFSLTDGSGAQLAHDFLTIEKGVEGKLLFKLVRDAGSWAITPLSQTTNQARRWQDVADAARSLLV